MRKLKKRVVVAMSGGVDSSVAAALLIKQGYEVVGMTMCFSLGDTTRKKPACCGIQGIEDARRVCHALGIRHYVVNMRRALERWVIRDFCQQYISGRTPNPCIRCNQFLKFDILLKKALSLDARFLATGHYARISVSRAGNRKPPTCLLKKARDKKKDQSYFLYRLTQEQMRHVLFPLGNYSKQQVRCLAREFKLPVAEKIASQEICFLPEDDYRLFLKPRVAACLAPGPIVDTQGRIIARHQGIALYTVGQREGLGIAAGYPLYITHIDARGNRIIVGRREEALKRTFLVKDTHYLNAPIKKKVVLRVRIRYNHRQISALITPCAKAARVSFRIPQFAVTPGQSAVFYDKDTVIGGGVIDAVLD